MCDCPGAALIRNRESPGWNGCRVGSVAFFPLVFGWYRVKVNGKFSGWLRFPDPEDFRGFVTVLASGERAEGTATLVILEERDR